MMCFNKWVAIGLIVSNLCIAVPLLCYLVKSIWESRK